MNPVEFDAVWSHALAFPLALLVVLAATPLVIRMARRFDWVAHPRQDRWHEESTALMGGIAIFVGAALAAVATVPMDVLWPIGVGATLLFVTGFVDDRVGLRPGAKLAAQIVATAILIYDGYAFGATWPVWLSVPLTLLWVVGITNAVNLLDNMDGLASGIAVISAATLVAFAALIGSPLTVGIGGSVAGAALGFLVYNFKPARIFMGDCGSLFLGFSIAALALVVQKQAPIGAEFAVALVPLSVLAVPIFDTTLVTFVRKLAGRAISQGGRDHSSHRLVFLGLTERSAVLMLYGLSLLTGAVSLIVLFVDVKLFYALVCFTAMALVVFGVHLARADVYDDAVGGDGAPRTPHRPLAMLQSLFGHRWKALFGVLADAMLVAAAFVLANYLRYEHGLGPSQEARLVEALPLIVAAKVSVFYAMGLYRGIWRHAGTPEIVRIVGATGLASLATAGVLVGLYDASVISWSVLLIDWMTVTLAVGGIRFGFRGLRQYLSSKRRDGRRVLLYGAGDAGVLALRQIRQNPSYGLAPVGFIDDDPLKQRQRVQGLKVLGTSDELRRICETHDVETIVVTTPRIPSERLRLVQAVCSDLDVATRVFDFGIEPLRSGDGLDGTPAPATPKVVRRS